MKVMLDTNILLSASLFPNGIAAKAYMKAVSHPNSGIVCEWSIYELKKVFVRKFPTKINAFNNFLLLTSTSFTILPTPKISVVDEYKIRDVNDRPLIRAAQLYDVDVFLTGEKDFLEAKIKRPQIMSPSQFLKQ